MPQAGLVEGKNRQKTDIHHQKFKITLDKGVSQRVKPWHKSTVNVNGGRFGMPKFRQLLGGCLIPSNQYGGVLVLKDILRFSVPAPFANPVCLGKGRPEVGLLLGTLSIFLAVFLLLQPIASAQSQFANLSGSVKDTSGAVVAGAAVTVKDASSGETRKTVTNQDGFFSLSTLPVGTYNVTVESKGFQKWHGT